MSHPIPPETDSADAAILPTLDISGVQALDDADLAAVAGGNSSSVGAWGSRSD